MRGEEAAEKAFRMSWQKLFRDAHAREFPACVDLFFAVHSDSKNPAFMKSGGGDGWNMFRSAFGGILFNRMQRQAVVRV